MSVSVESLCNELSRGKLLPADEVRALYQRWRAEAGAAAADAAAFQRWLGERKYLTAFQLGMIQRGHVERCRVGGCLLLDRIAQGRMAGIYQAKAANGRATAVKILPPSKAKDADSFARFQREARLALKLNHPNVVRTFEVAEDNGLHFLVMEYLDGETLEDVLKRRGRLPPAEALRVLHQALQGLDHLHEQDMVHRDLKPANLMLVPGHEKGKPDTTMGDTVKILDVGLGRALFDEGDPQAGGAELTAAGDVLGEPDYMAPEQARDARRADIRSDIYGLGCVLYHALTGSVPYPDSNPVRKLIRHATEKARPLSEFFRDAPPALQDLIDTMTAKDPAYRPPTPARAAQAVLEAQSALSAPIDPPIAVAVPVPVAVPDAAPAPAIVDVEPVRPVADPERRRRLDLVLVGLGGTLLLGGGIWLVTKLLQRKRKEDEEE